MLTKQSHESDLLKAQETDFDTKRRLLLFPLVAVCQCEWVDDRCCWLMDHW